MPALRRPAGRPAGQPRISPGSGRQRLLLESESPYGSRRVTVESDGVATAAYLHSASEQVAAAWIANHVPAPDTTDWARLDTGLVPVMPAHYTKHPDGRPVPEPGTLRALWLEEGDGVAILEHGGLLAVIPGWASIAQWLPGYCRDIVGQTPFGWALDDAMEGLGPRVTAAGDFWRWRAGEGSWPGFQQAMLGHLMGKLGPGARYWDVSGGKEPPVGVSERPPAGLQQYTVLSTVGMSCQRMPVIEQQGDNAASGARIELAIATTMASTEAARIFLWLGQYPWREMTWLGDGQCIPWYHEPSTFPLGRGEAVLLLEDPSGLIGPKPPDLSGFSFAGEAVRWLWVIPVSDRERRLRAERGPASLVIQLAAQRRSWVVGPG
jgi:hypothetical protein